MDENELDTVISEIIETYGLPKILQKRIDARQFIKEEILANLYESFTIPIEWWILKFEGGKLYISDPAEGWKLIYSVGKEKWTKKK